MKKVIKRLAVRVAGLWLALVGVSFSLSPASAEAQGLRSPEGFSTVAPAPIDCLMGSMLPAPTPACGERVELFREILIPPSNGGAPCPSETPTIVNGPCDCIVSGNCPTSQALKLMCGQQRTVPRPTVRAATDGGKECSGECVVVAPTCTSVQPVCGNGVREIENTLPVEECDGSDFKEEDANKPLKFCGAANDPTMACKLFYCGDGRVDLHEQCDGSTYKSADFKRYGRQCGAPTSGANACKISYCGDGALRADEQCDGDLFHSNHAGLVMKQCNAYCQISYCGNSVVDTGEQCDDGNNRGGDGCSSNCQTECQPVQVGINLTQTTVYAGHLGGGLFKVVDQYVGDFVAHNATSIRTHGFYHVAHKLFFYGGHQYGASKLTSRTYSKYCCIGGSCGPCAVAGNNSLGHLYTWTDNYHHQISYPETGWVCASNACSARCIPARFDVYGTGSSSQYGEAWYASPVSLNFSNGPLDVNALAPSRASFKLTEDQSGEVFWYGSEQTPLLVWDPSNKGEITDGKQLFGSWTFGKGWDDGYQALASLDANKDLVLTEQELRGIRLWFDTNKNGVSEQGEIRDLTNYGITELSTQYAIRQEVPLHSIQFLIQPKGYKVTVNGSPEYRETFDWLVPSKVSEESWSKNIAELKKDNYEVLEWSEDPLEYLDNKSNGYLVFKRDATGKKISGFHVRSLKILAQSVSPDTRYSVGAFQLDGEISANEIKFKILPSQVDLLKETIEASGKIENGKIIGGEMQITHQMTQPDIQAVALPDFRRTTKWKVLGEPILPSFYK